MVRKEVFLKGKLIRVILKGDDLKEVVALAFHTTKEEVAEKCQHLTQQGS